MIPFNKPFLVGSETKYIEQAVNSGKISGNGGFTKKCQEFFETEYKFKKALLTTSCTDALEMAAILLNIQSGDEVIVPSYTFVSSALAFVRQGAKIVFADSNEEHPGIDEKSVENLITDKTIAIVIVHYAGVSCDMDIIMDVASRKNIYVVEDAAQAIDSYFNGKPLGSIGDLGAFSFHETKNIIAGEGGLLSINNIKFIDRAEVIWEKGTNRSAFFKGEVDKYGWVDTGSSFLPSELIAAFLYAQLEKINLIQDKRKELWNVYNIGLEPVFRNGNLKRPFLPGFATNNAHMYYVLANSPKERELLIAFLKKNNVHAVFHYISLHKSSFYLETLKGNKKLDLPQADKYTSRLIRLPLFFELKIVEVEKIISLIIDFFDARN